MNAAARRILVADGERDLLEAIDFTLRAEGYEVEGVLDGETALSTALAGEFDLVILDARLPRLSGSEVCRRLREQSNVPIVVHPGDNLQAGAEIATVEARHAAYLNLVNGDSPFPDAFDDGKLPSQIVAAVLATGFVVSCPASVLALFGRLP